MEEKKTEIGDSFRTLLGRKFSFGSLFSASNKLICPKSNKLGIRGFTLVELIIVVSLIGILATGLIALINPVQQLKNSRDARRKSDLRQIQSALELFRSDCGNYPPDSPNPFSGTSFSGTCTGPTITYLQTIPKDPLTGSLYTYALLPGGGYSVISCIENVRDPEKVPTTIGCSSGFEIRFLNP